jgi:hypothetical protein
LSLIQDSKFPDCGRMTSKPEVVPQLLQSPVFGNFDLVVSEDAVYNGDTAEGYKSSSDRDRNPSVCAEIHAEE